MGMPVREKGEAVLLPTLHRKRGPDPALHARRGTQKPGFANRIRPPGPVPYMGHDSRAGGH